VTAIHGRCDARFARVRSALADNFAVHDELGAAVAVALDGRLVVDLWAGWADGARTRAWTADTLVDVFSAGKAMAALVLLRSIEGGLVDVDAPVMRYWPAFGAAGKEGVTVRHVLAHRAGLPAIRQPLPAGAMYDWDRMTGALAAEAPWWPPGGTHGYHVTTFGWLVGELVRRVAGESIGTRFRREIAGPLAADFSFGVAARDADRVAEYVFGGEPRLELGAAGDGDAALLVRHAYGNPPGVSGLGTVNTPAWRAAEMPSTNGHASARGLARVYAALAVGGTLDGVHVVADETLAAATAEASAGVDAVLGRPSRFGLGFQLTQPERPLGTSPRAFGHFGAGGSVGFADPDARLAFGYTMNRAGPRWQNPRNRALIDALYASL
jgi:CubicO group peptidase (beta-lactamase class C family)